MRPLALLALVLALGGCGGKILAFTVKDARWSAAYATARGDASWAQCMTVVADEIEGAAGALASDPPGLLGHVTVLKEAYDSRAAGTDALDAACAQDAMKFIRFTVKMGAGAFPGGGSLGALTGR